MVVPSRDAVIVRMGMTNGPGWPRSKFVAGVLAALPSPLAPTGLDMQITANTTGMAADLGVAADVEARDHCVIVIKGSFQADPAGAMTLLPEQPPPCATDEHYGDPATTSLRRANDFALYKPRAELLVDGFAHVPEGSPPVPELRVTLEVGERRKQVLVSGERVWVSNFGSASPSPPVPFTRMPLRFERAFGGPLEPRNPVGVGYHPKRSARDVDGLPVPNLEAPDERVERPDARTRPVGLGPLGRSWQPRLRHAGTYDARWRSERCPFLPDDFDARYFLSAPEDQHFDHFRGAERIRCHHMAARPVVTYVLPTVRVPVHVFTATGPSRAGLAVLDTVILQPHLARAELVWRTSVPLTKKLGALREVRIGELPARADGILGYRDGKPHFGDLRAALRWLRRKPGSPRR
ncbi:hypothetical protein ENSA5_39720 [Enhygromyxa salina]|uniref:DUF2169 domain-containing protein n=1 Tax=Enhygromyxa salina TaxID=215803 RepID=A0A2S9XR93_9BACT|nr:DUF2169 domain-containing protein [Enhygromyxa salina]PRP95387.1 hypothetical protein ENSA5_39720 [Enhygromyxa salina]